MSKIIKTRLVRQASFLKEFRERRQALVEELAWKHRIPPSLLERLLFEEADNLVRTFEYPIHSYGDHASIRVRNEEIRALREQEPRLSMNEIGRRYGLTGSTISTILKGASGGEPLPVANQSHEDGAI